jgi:ADP-ribosylglycohydrolase
MLLEGLVRGLDWDAAFAGLSAPDFLKVEGSDKIMGALGGSFHLKGCVDVLAEAVRVVAEAESAEEAIVSAVSLGGDTDTRGAVAGALAGGRWGLKAIPVRWIRKCPDAREALRLCSLLHWTETG